MFRFAFIMSHMSNTNFQSTKVIELGSCAFRQWRATDSHCRHIHGYQLKAKIWFGCNSLDDRNWVVDFGGLKDLKAILQGYFDHTLTVAADDPELELLRQLAAKDVVNLRVFDGGVGIEKAAEFVFNLTQEYITTASSGRCWVNAVEVFEHADNSAVYSNQLVFGNMLLSDATQVTQAVITPLTNETDTLSQANFVSPLQPPQSTDRSAHVGPNTSSGKGDWFAGTSWGNK